uniref:Uncharacterized protein n=1 Tax=Phlebotomus papatasi TaxID=29031 RepID=A0A1B0D8S9_PHLPP
MWFRPGSSTNVDSDRFRVSSFKNRIRGRKASKSLSSEYPSVSEEHDNVRSDKTQSVDEELLSECQNKEKILLTDPKYKNNRITKSSSKGKISAEIDSGKGKTLHVVVTGGRKISAPPVLDPSKATASTANVHPVKKSNTRAHSNLNLNALLRYTLANANKRLSSEEFERIRRKSLSDSTAGGVASSNKSSDDVTNASIEDTLCADADDVCMSQCDGSKSGMDGQEVNVTLKGVSPKNSLTSRVAAKLSESTSRGKKNKGKKRKGTRRQSSGSALNVLCGNCLANK